jgi:hypothetical protein
VYFVTRESCVFVRFRAPFTGKAIVIGTKAMSDKASKSLEMGSYRERSI